MLLILLSGLGLGLVIFASGAATTAATATTTTGQFVAVVAFLSPASSTSRVLRRRRDSQQRERHHALFRRRRRNKEAAAVAEEGGSFEGPRRQHLPPGLTPGFFVTQRYPLNLSQVLRDGSGDATALARAVGLDPERLDRLEVTPSNLTLPVALVLADPETYPTLSRARKACRKGSILVSRRPSGDTTSITPRSFNDSSTTFEGKVGDRVFPESDVLGRQVRIGSGGFPVLSHKKPPFDLPVAYEDDYFAVVNKPAGVVVYKQNKGGHGIMVRAKYVQMQNAKEIPRLLTISVVHPHRDILIP